MLANAKQHLQEASISAFVTLQTQAVAGAERIADSRKIQAAIITPIVLAMTSTVAIAATCEPTATRKLTSLIASAAKFMMAIGGSAALLCFVIGGVLIMVGGTSERVGKGKKLITNTLIGLAVMAGGFFLKTVILSFVGGATGTGATDSCLKKGDELFGG